MKKKTIYINFDEGSLCDAFGASITTTPQIAFQAQPTWSLNFLSFEAGNASVPDLSDAVSWHAAIDTDFTTSTTPMIRTLDSGINHSQATSGIIEVSLNSNTDNFFSKVNGKRSIEAFFELRGLDSNDAVIYDFIFPVAALGSVDPQGR